MSKLALALGKKYEENRLSVMTRQFELGNHTFRVRVPSVGEIERIYEYFKNPNADDVEIIYKAMTAEFEKFKNEKNDSVQFKDNDIVIEGRSMRETAKNKSIVQYRIVEYIKFLIPETGEMPDDLTYQDVEDEWPLAIQIKIVDKINEVISPEYKDIREK